MGFFDDLFGGFFDFNNDGKTSWDEELLGMAILQDIDSASDDRDSDEDLFGFEDDEF